jgi:hypothetical protein
MSTRNGAVPSTKRKKTKRTAQPVAGWELAMHMIPERRSNSLQEKLKVVWPEDRLMWEYFRRHPEVRQIPYQLNSFEPPFVKRFALRQYQLMQQGMDKEDAYVMVSEEMEEERLSELRWGLDIHMQSAAACQDFQVRRALDTYYYAPYCPSYSEHEIGELLEASRVTTYWP